MDLNNNQYKIVYKMKIAMELIKKGFKPVATMPNPNNNKLMVWVFDKTSEFMTEFNSLRSGN